jgi:sialic acid synthase SpsE
VDWQAALEPDEFKRFVTTIRTGSVALGGNRVLPLSDHDRRYRQFQKKSITAAVPIPKGAQITREKLVYLRHSDGLGLAPSEMATVVGRRTARDIAQYEPLKSEDLTS